LFFIYDSDVYNRTRPIYDEDKKELSFSDLSLIGDKNTTFNHTSIIEVFRDLEVLKKVREKIKIQTDQRHNKEIKKEENLNDVYDIYYPPLKKFEKVQQFLSEAKNENMENKYKNERIELLLNSLEENEDTELLLSIKENIEIF
jgi:hypothetical protein